MKHLTKIYLVVCLAFGATSAFGFDGIRSAAFAIRAEIESLNNLAEECYINKSYACSQRALQTIMEQPDNVAFLSEMGGATVCSTLRNLDRSYARLVEETQAVPRLKLLTEYETLLKTIRTFDIEEASLECVQASQQSAGAYFLLQRGWTCHLLNDATCATEAVMELTAAKALFSWGSVASAVGESPITLREIYGTLHRDYAWDAEILRREVLGKDYQFAFFYDNLQ